MTEEPDERGIWWLDARARRQMAETLMLDPDHVTFTVYEARPLRLTHAEVRCTVCTVPQGCAWVQGNRSPFSSQT